ncbi:MAG: D-ribose pyranase [Chloroflexi bacterium]|nr:D-ribose pyranase [Chloroflexota bacterium]
MKRTFLLHQDLSAAVAGIGHTDSIALVDAGYSVPRDAHRIDLAVRPHLPRLADVLEAVLSELSVEGYVVAEEMTTANGRLLTEIERVLSGVPGTRIAQSEFKARVRDAKAVVRTGEYTPFGNVLLVGGVPPAFLEGSPGQPADENGKGSA